MRIHHTRFRSLLVGLVGASLIAACNLNIDSVPDGGIVGSIELFGRTINFSLGDVGAIDVPANTPTEVPVGFRLFDETPTMVPPSGTMRLPSSSVGVGQRLSKAMPTARALPLNGSGTIRFRIASGTSASLCDSAITLAEYELTYNAGVAAIVDEEYELSQEALAIIITNDVTICIEITLDFDAVITLDGFTFSFGGSSGALSGTFNLSNDDAFENIHILMPGEDFDPATNRLTPGAGRTVTIDVAGGETVNVRAGRNGAILASTDCPAVTGSDFTADASWNGATLSCNVTPTGDGSGDPDTPAPGTIIQVPIDNAGGIAAPAPVTTTLGGVDYGVVGVLYDQTPLTNFPIVEPDLISVDLTDLGLEAVSTIYMAVHSSFVPDLSNGVSMGTLTVFYAEGGATDILAFTLGGNTAEWSYDRPENAPVAHSLATTLYTFPTEIDSAFEYLGREYAVTLPVDASRTISCITLALPAATTYSALREDSPTDTYASQYVAAMTLEGPAGAPDIVGDCTGISIPVPDCDADGFCNPLCAPGDDPDCTSSEDCSADGECNDNCTAATPDPDCEEDCSADGICNANCSELDPDPDCTVVAPGDPKCTARSDFESGDDGWTLQGDAEGGRSDPDFNVTGGNPGAFISADDDALGGIWYFQAPAEYRGNFAAAYGQTLSFDLKQSIDNSQLDRRDIIITGDGGSVIWFDTANNPGTDWTAYSVVLDASAGWMNDDDSPASEAQIRAVLADIEDLQIRGEYRNGEDTGSLDNVVLNSGCP
jgi:hypothetical protein